MRKRLIIKYHLLNCLFELLYNSKVKKGRWSKLSYKLFRVVEPKRRKCASKYVENISVAAYSESIINVEA